jgi:4-amino-4-deoxy-L-arabinose transferase-like glycosyltransferase
MGLGLLSLTPLLAVAAQRSFSSIASWGAWLLHLGSLVAVLAGAFVLDWGKGRVEDERRWGRLELGSLLAILVLGAGVRYSGLDALPFGTWYDEAENGLVAVRLLEDPNYRPVYEPRVNSAGHYLLLLAAAVQFLGRSTLAIRVVSALLGTAAVAAGYLVGREMFGRRMGLVLAFLLAVSRWSINFSRVGMYNISTPLFELVAVGFLLRGLRRRRSLDFAVAGLALGLGMVFYRGFLPFPLVIGAFLLHSALAERDIVRRSWRSLLVLALAMLLAMAPVAQYAYSHEGPFWERTRKISVLKGKENREALAAIAENTAKHLLMFNYRGDRYGRHNLPGEPMLDPLTGALMVLGLGLCLWKGRKPRSLLLPLWLAAMLLPGILSLEWEAPQALRTIGSLPVACLLAVVSLHGLGQEWRRVLGRHREGYFLLIVLLLLAAIGCANVHLYFQVQARDFDSWRDFSAPQTIAARLMAGLGDSVDFYVISYYQYHPVLRFLAPRITDYRVFHTHDDLPLPKGSGKAVVMILDGDSKYLFQEAQHRYPRAEFLEYGSPFGGPPVLHVIRLSPEDLSSIQGLVGRYWPGSDKETPPLLTRQDALLSFRWADGLPLDPPFRVEWNGVLRAPEFGLYRLILRSPGTAHLYLDEALLLEGEGEFSREVVLAEGNHTLRVEAVGVEGRFELAWQPPGEEEQVVPPSALYTPPVTGHGLLGTYYANGDWQAPAAFARIDPRLGLYFHVPPLPTPYTVEWEGRILIPERGRYVFALQAIDDGVLYIDGKEVAASLGRSEYDQKGILLSEGYHDVRVRYAARTDHMFINLYWTPPGETREIIPPEVLFPAQGSWQLVDAPAAAGE